jgi:hypothetical protein
MMKRQDPQQQGILNYVDVNSVDKYMEKVKKLGGKILLPKMAVPNVGYLAVCMDTENNTFGIFEDNKKAK